MSVATSKLIKNSIQNRLNIHFFTSLSPRTRRLRTTTSGLAQRRLTLQVRRATAVRVRTSFSAELLPPLRQTARCVAGIDVEISSKVTESEWKNG